MLCRVSRPTFRSTPGRPTPAVTASLVLLLSLGLSLAGCGGSSSAKGSGSGDKPDGATTACRAQWQDLNGPVSQHADQTNPSALAQRWDNVAGTVDHYATSATASDCGKTLATQQKAITSLEAFSAKLAPYDMELAVARVHTKATAYAQLTKAPRPKPVPRVKGKKRAKPAPSPKPAAVRAALRTLTTQAPLATQQQGPGWEQAAVVDLTSTKAVAKAVKDLKFLSTQSKAWRACQPALSLVRKAVRLAG